MLANHPALGTEVGAPKQSGYPFAARSQEGRRPVGSECISSRESPQSSIGAAIHDCCKSFDSLTSKQRAACEYIMVQVVVSS